MDKGNQLAHSILQNDSLRRGKNEGKGKEFPMVIDIKSYINV